MALLGASLGHTVRQLELLVRKVSLSCDPLDVLVFVVTVLAAASAAAVRVHRWRRSAHMSAGEEVHTCRLMTPCGSSPRRPALVHKWGAADETVLSVAVAVPSRVVFGGGGLMTVVRVAVRGSSHCVRRCGAHRPRCCGG